jgi:ribosomal protein L11 methyltransferase
LKEAYPTLEVTITVLAQREWTRTWLDHFQPMSFGQRLWIVPLGHSFEVENKEAAIVRLDPGLAFGTGTHPTTALCLRWLDTHPLRHLQIVDYGCGSGVLGIAALLLGAQKVFAIDYDPQALWSTRENARRNALTEEQLVTLHPDEISEPIPCSQVILANILAEPLIQLAPRIKECCQIGGMIVLSGLLTTQMDAVKAAYSAWFKFDEPQIKEEWVLLTAKRIV